MKKIMTRAWKIAKEAVKKFGGKVKEYFAESLKMAWAEVKEAKKITIKTTNKKIISFVKNDAQVAVFYKAKENLVFTDKTLTDKEKKEINNLIAKRNEKETVDSNKITDSQYDYLIFLSRENEFGYLINPFKIGSMTKSEASSLISEVKALSCY